jgi:hypothetical protein
VRIALLALVGLLAASPVAAADLDALAGKLARDAEIADQDRRSEALNVQINQANAAVQARNDAVRTAYEKALAEHAQTQADYDAKLAAQQAQVAAHDKAMAQWQAQVAACKAGDVKACRGAGGGEVR